MIGESVKKVQTGTREAAESGKAMDDIRVAVRKVAETMTAMQTVRADQRLGVTQVSRAVEQMNQGTQQTAAMVEEVAATADLLSEQAEQLSQAVAAFKLAGEDGRSDAEQGTDAYQSINQPDADVDDSDANDLPPVNFSGKALQLAQSLPAIERPLLRTNRHR